MRSDYALYMVAIIFFIITGISIVLAENLWVVTTAVLGLLFAGLGYTQKPKAKPKATMMVETPPSAPTPPSTVIPTATQVVNEEKIEVTTEAAAPSVLGLTEVNGIGEKRKEQLNTLGISNVEDLAKASADILATKLKISPKITGKWIENARKLLEKS
jgi:predicted flap endonuclease-1-like 5' DNA nuclease